MADVTSREALRRALDEELERDKRVFLMGEEIGRFEGSYKVTAGGTFTVSNLGMFGISSFAAVVDLPEPGILAVGAAAKRPVVIDDAVQIRPIMNVTLSVDHRAISGAEGAALLALIRRILEHPVLLLA